MIDVERERRGVGGGAAQRWRCARENMGGQSGERMVQRKGERENIRKEGMGRESGEREEEEGEMKDEGERGVWKGREEMEYVDGERVGEKVLEEVEKVLAFRTDG